MRYSSAKNEYECYIQQTHNLKVIQVKKTWQSGVYRYENIFRKEENDWKMVYLARAEDTQHAEIEWKFDFSENNLKIKDISLNFDVKVYETGMIEITFLHKGERCFAWNFCSNFFLVVKCFT